MNHKTVFRLLLLSMIIGGLSVAYAEVQTTNDLQQPPAAPSGMVFIPSGIFIMGCTAGDGECAFDEYPRHKVSVKEFFLDITEVTVIAYQSCVNEGRCTSPKSKSDSKWQYQNCYWGQKERNDHPLNCVDWNQAKAYCEWKGGKLPSEVEWEYAARGGHNNWKYPWGNDPAEWSRAVMDGAGVGGCGKNSTWPAGSKGINGFGLADMVGSVWEWVEDCYHKNYEHAPADNQAWVSADCDRRRILRSGTWDAHPSDLRVSIRGRGNIDASSEYIGFRCAKSVE